MAPALALAVASAAIGLPVLAQESEEDPFAALPLNADAVFEWVDIPSDAGMPIDDAAAAEFLKLVGDDVQRVPVRVRGFRRVRRA
jgi:hypothetical protein